MSVSTTRWTTTAAVDNSVGGVSIGWDPVDDPGEPVDNRVASRQGVLGVFPSPQPLLPLLSNWNSFKERIGCEVPL